MGAHAEFGHAELLAIAQVTILARSPAQHRCGHRALIGIVDKGLQVDRLALHDRRTVLWRYKLDLGRGIGHCDLARHGAGGVHPIAGQDPEAALAAGHQVEAADHGAGLAGGQRHILPLDAIVGAVLHQEAEVITVGIVGRPGNGDLRARDYGTAGRRRNAHRGRGCPGAHRSQKRAARPLDIHAIRALDSGHKLGDHPPARVVDAVTGRRRAGVGLDRGERMAGQLGPRGAAQHNGIITRRGRRRLIDAGKDKDGIEVQRVGAGIDGARDPEPAVYRR